MASGISIPISYLALIALLGLLVVKWLSKRTANYHLPPGPRPLPIIGNVLDLPPKGIPEYQHWFKHKDAYGPISSINVMGLHLVIFHDKEAAYAVMGKKAQKTSARPQMNFAAMCGFENFLITHQYDAKYRLHRKMVQQEIGTKGLSATFQPIQDQESLQFILQTFNNPDNMMVYLKTLAAAIVLKITYGYAIERDAVDPLAELIEHTMDNLSQAFVPLAWVVDSVPAIEYLPDWFPGTSYRKTAREWKAVNEAAAELPYSFVKRQLARKAHRPSYVSNLLEQYMAKNGNEESLSPADEEAIKWSAVSLYAAGSDSTVAIIESVILAFLIFPEVVQKAQEEIDHVVGSDRLPNFEDRKDMPYVDGIIKEAWRWNPVGPMGLTHKSEEDIVYGEYLIPKGSYLLPSLWWFLHDPKDYSEPGVFKPERYMAPLNEPDPSDLAFGYGRRACAGRFFADASVYITVVRLLAVFQIRKAKDAHGNDIPVKLESVSGMVNRPKPYQFKIEPRSAHYADLLRRIEAEQGPMAGDAPLLNISTV
ncbi:cytochrome P450 [Aspergillus pseudocaelatus]|uniref:Cytochrome P450 n=1 Tax=Aspergillus pseudocaelatus TaxID=1825620 RepID=A0ABQ6WVT0_9EURO|nr:cytochrome P450 [Aspergillus pseudocaelatus]